MARKTKQPKTETLFRDHGKAYKRFAKRTFWKGNRRAAKQDPENAPRKVVSFGWY